jgi:CRISPR system Cascade subunit CasD
MIRDVLVLRLDAPLQAFGGVVVDQRGPTQGFPARSTLAGLLGNALGYDHRDAALLGALQARLRFGLRRDRTGSRIVDFQTVALGQPFLESGWTTRGAPEARGGAFSDQTHIRYREYWADAVFTVALTLEPDSDQPTLDALEAALLAPERPLFIGRKPCIPSVPLVLARLRTASLLEALASVPRISRERWDSPSPEPLAAWVPGEERPEQVLEEIPVTDERDWSNQIVVGRRIVKRTVVRPPEGDHVG